MLIREGTARLFDPGPTHAANRLEEAGAFCGVPAFWLDVPETIPALGYGSHQFFRYYGKFPSAVGREIVSKHAIPGVPVLDIYAGCGTTLVEAQNAGYSSFGIDLNPLGVLACNVKTTYFDATALRSARDRVLQDVDPSSALHLPTSLPAAKLDKWFHAETQRELSALRLAILRRPA